MSGAEKAEVLGREDKANLSKHRVFTELDIPRSTYYRWLRRKQFDELEDRAGGGKPPWNRLTSQEVDCVLATDREMPELCFRQLAAWITDHRGFSVSESMLYRI